jgi:hypothetical protein
MLLPPNTTATAAIERRLYLLSSTAATAAIHCHRQMTTPTFIHQRCQTLTLPLPPATADVNFHRRLVMAYLY